MDRRRLGGIAHAHLARLLGVRLVRRVCQRSDALRSARVRDLLARRLLGEAAQGEGRCRPLSGVGVVPGDARLVSLPRSGTDHCRAAQVQLQVVPQRQPLHQLHRQIRVAVVDAGVEHLHHVRVRQLRQGLELARQPPRRPRIERRTGGEQLQRHGVTRAAVERAVHRSRASTAQRVEDAVGADDLGWHGRRQRNSRERPTRGSTKRWTSP